MQCICVPVIHLDPNAIVQPDTMQLQNPNILPTVAPAPTAAFLPWQLEEECGSGNSGNPPEDGGPIFPPRSSDAMKYPYQDGPKKKQNNQPNQNGAPRAPVLSIRRNSSSSPVDGIEGKEREREGKKEKREKHKARGKEKEREKTRSNGLVKEEKKQKSVHQTTALSLNIATIVLTVALGVVILNKFLF
eukprot:TRINITY_DN1469_c0_g1_i2.p1 TRINITY_DN1469_c0_g1~~TRINITY_DN1469_c0_g1_i2.p1  ORF type:complete len:189 (-),score=51.27 TRINITY_DN1469_c0_g1_i2:93-659(-)